MKTLFLIAMLGSPFAGTALAEDASTTAPGTETSAAARTRVHDALEAEASLPVTPPTLPDSASQTARDVHSTTAFGQKGAAERAAHSEAQNAARDAVSRARADAANRAAQGAAASAARSANADSHAAAGQNRADDVHGRSGSGSNGNGNGSGNGRLHAP